MTIAGHVHWNNLGTFLFAHLANLRPGQLIYTQTARAQTAWRITSVVSRSKTLPLDRLAFVGPTGPRRLVLITCGGAYETSTHSYVDNVYVFAVLAAQSLT